MRAAADQQYLERTYENDGLPELMAMLEPDELRVLDVGCGAGANARLVKQSEPRRQVTGITLSEAEAEVAREILDRVLVADAEEWEPDEPDGGFDALVLSHVLEHFVDPARFLTRARRWLRPGGHVYVALPNVLFLPQRWKFLRGEFRYSDMGVMDRTHLRFFDFEAARELVENAGFAVLEHRALGHLPQGPLRKLSPTLSRQIDDLAIRSAPGLFGLHILVKARAV